VTGELSASTPTSASQAVTVTFGYIGVVHWAELIQPQRWAGVITYPPEGEVRERKGKKWEESLIDAATW